jgi:branched-chain amino acid transport system ATP-binding protein
LADPILSLTNVTVKFGALRAVDSVSMTLQPGERRAVLGPNGAGKTTLFNAITGAIPPTTGKVIFDGIDMTSIPPEKRAYLGVARTFQITNLFGQMSVYENMKLAARGLSPSKFSLFGADTLTSEQEERVRNALAASRLNGRENAPVREMSYGEQRQLEVAMALVGTPRLLLLDEPAAGLSPAERGYLAEIIRGLPRDLTVVLIEHDMDLALALVDTVTVMQNGKVIVESDPADIRTNALVQEVYLGRPHKAVAADLEGGH